MATTGKPIRPDITDDGFDIFVHAKIGHVDFGNGPRSAVQTALEMIVNHHVTQNGDTEGLSEYGFHVGDAMYDVSIGLTYRSQSIE